MFEREYMIILFLVHIVELNILKIHDLLMQLPACSKMISCGFFLLYPCSGFIVRLLRKGKKKCR